MKTALLPIALLALALPGAALAYPAKVVYRFNTSQPVTAPYQAPVVSPAPYRPYGPVVSYGLNSQPAAPVTAVVRYRTPGSYGVATGSPVYGTPSWGAPVYRNPVYRSPAYVAAAPAPVGQTCTFNAGRALVGAALGGLASTALAPRPQDRRWAIPVGVAIGGLGGLATGC